jgi:membrane protease YdiL (CAAX protease family)
MLGLDPLAGALRALAPGRPGAAWAADAAALAAAAAAASAARGWLAPRRPRPGAYGGGGRAAATASAALALMGIAALAVRLLDPAFDEREFARRGLGDPSTLGNFLILIPFAVAAEQIVFRTCQDGIRRWLGPAGACCAVSGAFAIHHVDLARGLGAHEATTLLAAGAGGLVLALLYEVTPSVTLVAAVHLAHDVLAVAQARLNVHGRAPAEAALFAAWILAPGLAAAGLAWGRGRIRPPGPSGEPGRGRWARAGAAAAFGIALPALMSYLRAVT